MASLTMHTNNPGEEIRLYFLGSFPLKNIALASHSGIFEGIIQGWGWYNFREGSGLGLDVLNSDPLSLCSLQVTVQFCDVFFVLCSHFLLLRC